MALEMEVEGKRLADCLPLPLPCGSFDAVYTTGYIASPSLRSIFVAGYANIMFVHDEFSAAASSGPPGSSSISNFGAY